MSNAIAKAGQAQQFGAVAGNRSVTATAAGAEIPVEAMFAEVTSADAGYAIVLPSCVPGRSLHGYVGANGCEIWTRASGQKVNNVECFSANEAAVPATSYFEAVCVSATDWVLSTRTLAGAAGSTITPDSR